MKTKHPEPKTCQSCGREFEFRKKWKSNWDLIKFCSEECRKNKNNFDFTEKILELLKSRGKGLTICPSEVLIDEQKQDSMMMEHVRRSARLLAHKSFIEIVQKGQPVDPNSFKGPIRLRLK